MQQIVKLNRYEIVLLSSVRTERITVLCIVIWLQSGDTASIGSIRMVRAIQISFTFGIASMNCRTELMD